jgi:hypothetical protein
MVNRLWQHHFGRAIVATLENFGHSGVAPSHPALLDWLAIVFMERGWQLKRLHRLMMMSTAYRQSAFRPNHSPALTVDPENILLWRMNLRRMEAEVLRDAVLAVSGEIDASMGGPPAPVEARPDGLVIESDKGPTPSSHRRRSLYVKSLRGSHPGGQGFRLSMFEAFDFPEVVINCTRRTTSTTPLQSLALLNSRFMQEQAGCFANRVRTLAGDLSPAERLIETSFLLSLARSPSETELEFCRGHLRAQQEVYSESGLPPDQAAQRALTSLCAMLLASNEFLYSG